MLAISIDHAAIEDMVAMAEATEKQIETARLRTLRKMRKTIETKVKREASRKMAIPQRAIGDRFFSSSVEPGDDELKVWIGTWHVDPFSISQPVQNAIGVRVGRRSYPGAFLAKIYTSRQKVWIRLHSKHYSSELYPTRYRPGDRGWSEHRGRFPVVRAAVPIDEVMANVLETEGNFFAAEFMKIFQRELNYELHVRGKM